MCLNSIHWIWYWLYHHPLEKVILTTARVQKQLVCIQTASILKTTWEPLRQKTCNERWRIKKWCLNNNRLPFCCGCKQDYGKCLSSSKGWAAVLPAGSAGVGVFAPRTVFHKVGACMKPVKPGRCLCPEVSEKPQEKSAWNVLIFVKSFIYDISKQKFPDLWEFSTFPLPHPLSQVHVLQSALILKTRITEHIWGSMIS